MAGAGPDPARRRAGGAGVLPGAGLRKALDRVVGTALGVAAGLALASLLARLATAELVVLLALLVAGLWLLQISYRWTMALLTVAVAGAVVFFVLPARTRRTIDEHVATLLGALDDSLAVVEQGRPIDAVAGHRRPPRRLRHRARRGAA
jgi:uncharacterized membrane protein YgaE (UPF0421/DUF939 family)